MRPLLRQVLQKLDELRIEETHLVDPKARRNYYYEGMYRDGVVYVNPSWAVANTLLHEALHALKPRWKERTVRAWTTRLIKELSDEDVWRLWQEYNLRAHRSP